MPALARPVVQLACLAALGGLSARADAADAYQVARSKYEVTLAKSRFRPVADHTAGKSGSQPLKAPIGPGEAGQAVQVWAELIPSGQVVDPMSYRWSPKERFYLLFSFARPTYLALYQVPVGPGAPPRRVLPDPNFPKSRDVVPAGTNYRFEVAIELDDDSQDERMEIVTWVEGTPNPFEGVKSLPVATNPATSSGTGLAETTAPGAGKPNGGGGVGTGGGSKTSTAQETKESAPTPPKPAPAPRPSNPAVEGLDESANFGTTVRRVEEEVQEITDSDPSLRERMRFKMASPPNAGSRKARFNDDVPAIGTTDLPRGTISILFKK